MKNNLRYDPMDQSAEGLIWPALSGLMTGISADADVAGVTNLNATPIVVQRIRLRWFTITAFASAQCMAFRVNKVTGFTAVHTGGTPVAVQAHHNFGEGVKTNRATGAAYTTGSRIPLTEISGVIASTAALTAATYTAEDTDEPEVVAIGAGSTLPSVWESYVPPGPPLVLPQNTGLIVNLAIAMGASGVGKLFVGVDGYRLG
jgi:hypothetical protein